MATFQTYPEPSLHTRRRNPRERTSERQ